MSAAAALVERLEAAFHAQYGPAQPTHTVIAPGRVNLVGEHIDYNLLPVLPMAIGRHVGVMLRVRDDATIRIASTAPGFGAREFEGSAIIEPFRGGDWGNYVKAAVQGVARHASVTRGVDAIVHSDLPVAAGLSSSSALVVATALAILAANGLTIPRLELADLLAYAERYVGTAGGGMDQAVALCAVAAHALLVAFAPLRITPLRIPGGWRFVVAYSLVRAEKSGSAQACYNARTAECRAALEAMLRAVTRRPDEASYRGLRAAFSTEELLDIAQTALEPELMSRFRHVVTEADRVDRAAAALRSGALAAFGALLDESHESLKRDYEVSHPDLDALVAVAREAGAAGARLTGAGLGGCIVAACEAGQESMLLDAFTRSFYGPRGKGDEAAQHAFVVEPVGGAVVEEA